MYSPSQRPPRRHLPGRVYVARRVIAVAVVVLSLFAVYQVGSALFGGPSSPTVAAPVAPAISLTTGGGAPSSPSPTSSSTSTTELKPKEKTVPTAANKAVLYIAGDSDAGTFGPYLQKLMNKTKVVDTDLDYTSSTGLSRPDFYDWPTRFADQIPKVNPDIVIVAFGGNDAQGIRNVDKNWAVNHSPGSGGDDADWKAEYGKRVGAAMDYLGGDNRTLIWVGIPNSTNPVNTARLQVQNEVVVAEAGKRPKVVFIDTWNRFTGLDGGFATSVQDPRDGVFKEVRASDGFHLNQTGAEILALDVADAVRKELTARGAQL